MRATIRSFVLLGGILISHQLEASFCTSRLQVLGTELLATVPIQIHWQLTPAFEASKPSDFRAQIEGALKFIGDSAPVDSDHLFHWSRGSEALQDRSLQIYLIESTHPDVLQTFGGSPRLNSTFLFQSASGGPDRISGDLVYYLYADRIFRTSGRILPEEIVELEMHFAGDLRGRIRRFLEMPLDSVENARNLLTSPAVLSALDCETFIAVGKFLRCAASLPGYNDRPPAARNKLSRELADHLRIAESVQDEKSLVALEPVVRMALLIDIDQAFRRRFPNLKANIFQMLSRIRELSSKRESHLFHWEGDRHILSQKDYTLVITTKANSKWGKYSKDLPELGSGVTLFVPPDIPSETGGHIVQIIYIDALILPPITDEVGLIVLEGNLAYELLGRAHLYLNSTARTLKETQGDPIKVLSAEAQGYNAQAVHYEALLDGPADSMGAGAKETLTSLARVSRNIAESFERDVARLLQKKYQTP